MTFDDKLRDMTSDIGRGPKPSEGQCWACGKVRSLLASGTCRKCRADGFTHVLVASDAMAERDEHGEVKGVLF